MKLTLTLIVIALVSVSASTYSQNTRLDISLENGNITELFHEIQEKSEFFFFYQKNDLRELNNVTVNAQDATVMEILDKVLDGKDLTYEIVDRYIVVRPVNDSFGDEILASVLETNSAQQRTVTGTVTDASDQPLPGVTVVVKGTTQGTVTNADGNYSLTNIPEDATLQFSFVGMRTQEVEVGDQTTVNMTMEEEAIGIEEVVAIGYGTVRKGDLTGSVATVSSGDFERVPSYNSLQAIQGRATGLNITSNSGMPGAGNDVLIRGTQSISGTNSPIYVVDNIISTNIDHLEPGDIESISVLKDASATAIYGARAANGVILINTKRGVGIGETEISFTSYVGLQTFSNLKLDLLNAEEYLEIYTEAHENAGISPGWNQEDLQKYEGVDSDWMDAISQTGVIENYDVGLAGSSEGSNYYVSATYMNHKGMVLESGHTKYNLRFNSDHEIKNWIKFGNSLNIYSSETNGSSGVYSLAAIKVPLTRIYEDDGSYGRIRHTGLEHMHQNPVWQAKETVNNNKYKGVQGNLYLTLSLLPGLEFTTRGNLEYAHNYYTDFSPAINPSWNWEGSVKNLVEKQSSQNLHWNTDFLLDYNKTFGNEHDIKALAGYSLEESTFESLQASRNDTPNNEIRFLNAGDPESQLNSNSYSDWGFVSIFGRLNYVYANKYLLTASIRRDGTSRLAEGNRFGIFPSASVAWRITEEDFIGNNNFIDDLKVRASWGSVGNVLSVSTYGTVSSLTQRNYVFNESSSQGYTLASAVNSDLVWENTVKKNIGLDGVLFNNHMYTTIDVFIEDTKDLLFRQPIPNSTGLSGSPFINAGHVRNTGFEVLVGYRKTINDWSYDFSINATHTKNEAIDLEGRDLRTSGIVEGYPVNSFFGYESNGIISTQEELDNYPHLSGKQIGDIWIKDINGYDEEGKLTGEPDGEINSADRNLIGKRYPDLVYGAMGNIGYKNFSLQVQLQGIQGIDKNILGSYNDVFHYFTRWAMNHEASILDRFHPTKNPNGKWPIVSTSDTGHNRDFSDFWLKNASFLRIKNVNLNYNFSDELCNILKMNDLGIYISVQNLYTFTKFPGTEVDTQQHGFSGVPQPTTWTLGLKATF